MYIKLNKEEQFVLSLVLKNSSFSKKDLNNVLDKLKDKIDNTTRCDMEESINDLMIKYDELTKMSVSNGDYKKAFVYQTFVDELYSILTSDSKSNKEE